MTVQSQCNYVRGSGTPPTWDTGDGPLWALATQSVCCIQQILPPSVIQRILALSATMSPAMCNPSAWSRALCHYRTEYY